MRYLDELNRAPNQEALGMDLIRRSDVMRTFKSLGYKIIHLGSGWMVTNDNAQADILFHFENLNEFGINLLRNSILSLVLSKRLDFGPRAPVLYNLKKLKEIPSIPGPKFVFAHFVCPHAPFLFDRQGRLPPRTREMKRLEFDWLPKDRYVDQLYFISRQIDEVVSAILAQSKTPPLIILQGDHGPPSDGLTGNPTRVMIYERTSIFNAYYWPGAGRQRLYASITPVNTFRLLFDTYLGMHFGLLSDRSYYSGPTGAMPYEFVDKTVY